MKEKLILHCDIKIPKIKIIQLTSCDMDKKSLKIPKGNQNPYIVEEQTLQLWPKEKVQKDNDLQNIHIGLRWSNKNPTKNRGWTQVLRKGRQFLFNFFYCHSNSQIRTEIKSTQLKSIWNIHEADIFVKYLPSLPYNYIQFFVNQCHTTYRNTYIQYLQLYWS